MDSKIQLGNLMTYFAKSMDFLKFLKYIYVTIRVFMVVCMVEGMSYLMAPTKSMSVKVGTRHKILNIWFCIRRNHLEKINHLSRQVNYVYQKWTSILAPRLPLTLYILQRVAWVKNKLFILSPMPWGKMCMLNTKRNIHIQGLWMKH